MTEKQAKRVAAFKRRVSVKGDAVETRRVRMIDGRPFDGECVSIGWERSRDGRDMETLIDENGRTIQTRPTYSYGPRRS